MIEHRFATEMTLPLSRERVFQFFSDAANLERITPPELSFRILTPQPVELREGALIDYSLGLFGISFAWKTKITEWDPPHAFTDEQLRGPYRQWIHRHTFLDVDGGTEIVDVVRYALPLRLMGEVAYPFVAMQVRRIFAFRERAIRAALL